MSGSEAVDRYIRVECETPPIYSRAKLAHLSTGVVDTLNGTDQGLDRGPGYFVNGPCGTGKTYLAAAVLRYWVTSNRAAVIAGQSWNGTRYVPRYQTDAKFRTVPDILIRVRAAIAKGSVDGVVRFLQNVTGLVIDDLGAERSTDWSSECLYSIIATRINFGRPTIVTSNLTLDEINATDPRLASRLGGLTVVTLQGRDRRLSKG